ncbi:MAG TPA: hypothetical protein VHE81_05390 [Lacipirellulaceae bacterium]|nr:hypothetical protein [Lacipirellulaceae bacterium]
MAESRTVETLQRKRDEIARSIDDYEARLAQAKADLAHMDAAIAIFTTGDGAKPVRPYVDIHRLFKRGELAAISREELKGRPRDTRELAQAVMAAKGLDTGDRVLAKAVSCRLIHVLRIQVRTAKIVGIVRYKAPRIWRLPERLV